MLRILICVLALASLRSYACDITVIKTKADSKTMYLTDGSTLSLKVAKSLQATGCKFHGRIMNESELTTFKILRAEKALAKLKAGKSINNGGSFVIE